jgi:hypothetical protein
MLAEENMPSDLSLTKKKSFVRKTQNVNAIKLFSLLFRSGQASLLLGHLRDFIA